MNNDDMNLEELLTKAIEANAVKEDSPANGMKAILEFLEKGSLIKLAKYSQDKMEEIISKLAHDIDCGEKLSKEDVAVRCRKIIDTSRKLEVLHSIIMAAGVVGIGSETNYDENLDMIIKLCTF